MSAVTVHQHPVNPAFLAAIAAAPDDDLPRLVYADWLDENGQSERADYIRTACEFWKFDNNGERTADNKRWMELARKTKLMCAAVEASDWWVCEQLFPKPPRRPTNVQKKNYSKARPDFKWNRGFITEVQCRLQGWLWWGKALFQRHPTITTVRVTDKLPLRVTVNNIHRFLWISNESRPYGDRASDPVVRLPKEVFMSLTSEDGVEGEEYSKCYDSLQTAMDNLSKGLIKLARS